MVIGRARRMAEKEVKMVAMATIINMGAGINLVGYQSGTLAPSYPWIFIVVYDRARTIPTPIFLNVISWISLHIPHIDIKYNRCLYCLKKSAHP
jgi:hypothetical protein